MKHASLFHKNYVGVTPTYKVVKNYSIKFSCRPFNNCSACNLYKDGVIIIIVIITTDVIMKIK